MNDTYNHLKKLAILHKGPTDLNRCAVEYQEKKCPITFSFVFCEIFPMIVSTSKQYYNLNGFDVASFAMEELDKALLEFDTERGSKFTTYFFRNLNFKLRGEQTITLNQVRKANYNAVSFTQLATPSDHADEPNSFDVLLEKVEHGYGRFELSASISSSPHLSENEKKYCQLILNDAVNKDTEIAEILGISSAAVTYIKQSLKKKMKLIILG